MPWAVGDSTKETGWFGVKTNSGINLCEYLVFQIVYLLQETEINGRGFM